MGAAGPPGGGVGGRAGRGRRVRQRDREDRSHPLPRAHRLQALRTGGERRARCSTGSTTAWRRGGARRRTRSTPRSGIGSGTLPRTRCSAASSSPAARRSSPAAPWRPTPPSSRCRPTPAVHTYGILSNHFLEQNARTVRYEVTIDTSVDGEFTYTETTVIQHAKVPEAIEPHRPQHPEADRGGLRQPCRVGSAGARRGRREASCSSGQRSSWRSATRCGASWKKRSSRTSRTSSTVRHLPMR